MKSVKRYNYLHFWHNYLWKPRISKKLESKIRKVLPTEGSVLDIGCGNGRYVHLFEGMEYTGIDISEPIIWEAKRKYQDKRFIRIDIADFDPSTVYDLIFTSVTLQHIWPEKMPEIAEKLKRLGKKIVMLESTGTGEGLAPHCFHHDYDTLFNLTYKEELLGGVTLMVA